MISSIEWLPTAKFSVAQTFDPPPYPAEANRPETSPMCQDIWFAAMISAVDWATALTIGSSTSAGSPGDAQCIHGDDQVERSDFSGLCKTVQRWNGQYAGCRFE
jgi:hypothetical protein